MLISTAKSYKFDMKDETKTETGTEEHDWMRYYGNKEKCVAVEKNTHHVDAHYW